MDLGSAKSLESFDVRTRGIAFVPFETKSGVFGSKRNHQLIALNLGHHGCRRDNGAVSVGLGSHNHL
jgi:hypothetical protein